MNFSVSIIFLMTGWCEAMMRVGYIGEISKIYCPSLPPYSGGYKKICKQTTEKKCDVMVSTKLSISGLSGRFFIYEDKESNAVTFIINPVSEADSGEYSCMHETESGRSITFSKVKFWAMPLTGYLGGGAQLTLLYTFGYERHGKYLQKVGSSASLIHTEHGQIKADKGKFSLYDNIRAREVTVTFSRLKAEDFGRYMCGIKDVGPYIEWPLEVKNLTSVRQYEGHTVRIPCKYLSQWSGGKQKYFCRGRDPAKCLEQGALEQDRLTIKDSAVEEVFTVEITNFKAEDSGVYWCVEFGVSQPEFTCAIQLAIKTGNILDPTPISSHSEPPPISSSESNWVTWIGVLVPVVVVLLATGLLFMVVKYKRTSARPLPDHLMSTKTTDNTQMTGDDVYDDAQTSGETLVDPTAPSRKSNTPSSHAEYQNSDEVTNKNQLYLAVLPEAYENNPANHSLDNKTDICVIVASHAVNLHPSTSLRASTYQQLDPNTNQGDSGYMSI